MKVKRTIIILLFLVWHTVALAQEIKLAPYEQKLPDFPRLSNNQAELCSTAGKYCGSVNCPSQAKYWYFLLPLIPLIITILVLKYELRQEIKANEQLKQKSGGVTDGKQGES